MFYGGEDAYFKSGWNIMDGALVVISIIDLLMSLISESSPRIFGILRVRLYKTDSIILTNILVVHLLNEREGFKSPPTHCEKNIYRE